MRGQELVLPKFLRESLRVIVRSLRSLRGKIRVVKIRAAHCRFVGISLGEAVDRSAAGLTAGVSWRCILGARVTYKKRGSCAHNLHVVTHAQLSYSVFQLHVCHGRTRVVHFLDCSRLYYILMHVLPTARSRFVASIMLNSKSTSRTFTSIPCTSVAH